MNGCATVSPASTLRFLSCWNRHICSSATVSPTRKAANRTVAVTSRAFSGASWKAQAWWMGAVKSQISSIWPAATEHHVEHLETRGPEPLAHHGPPVVLGAVEKPPLRARLKLRRAPHSTTSAVMTFSRVDSKSAAAATIRQ